MPDAAHLERWLAFVFDRRISEPEWYWADDAPEWDGSRVELLDLIATAFEDGGHRLATFSDAQLEQGFWFLLMGPDAALAAIFQADLPLKKRLRAVRSFVPLFQRVMAGRCLPTLSHCDEAQNGTLNPSCYMGWDLLRPFSRKVDEAEQTDFEEVFLACFRDIISIPHDACRESAIHGIGHWKEIFPALTAMLDDFLAHNAHLRPELVAYATQAREIGVL